MDSDFKLVQKTGKYMAAQDNRSTQYPLFVIQNLNDDGEYVFSLRAGIFLTDIAAMQHLKENSHHYSDKARVYGIAAWRNPEMQAVMRQVIKAGEQEIPSHYA
ncbi:MAG: hypothetical protein WC426_13460 [Sulfuriferula sp.]